jgi:hypothetical protein
MSGSTLNIIHYHIKMRECEHTGILRALVKDPQRDLGETYQENPTKHPGGAWRPPGPQGPGLCHQALRSQPCTASMDTGHSYAYAVWAMSPHRPQLGGLSTDTDEGYMYASTNNLSAQTPF